MPKVNTINTNELSRRQEQVLRYIFGFQEQHQYSPSLNEIARELRVSIPTAHQHIQALVNKGFITKVENEPRSIRINSNISGLSKIRANSISIPVLGAANAGFALINAQEYLEGYLRVSSAILKGKKNVFAIRVEGDSMNKADLNGKKIEDGDFVLVDPGDYQARNGDYVLSIIDGSANIKKFHQDKKTGGITLLPESSNPEHKPIFISSQDNFIINGKIIGVIKR